MALFSNRIRIGDLLVQKGYITDDQLSTALEEQREKKQRLGEVLISLGFVTEEQFASVYCDQSGIEPVDLKEIKLNEELLQMVGEELMRKQEMIPFGYDEENFNRIYYINIIATATYLFGKSLFYTILKSEIDWINSNLIKR